MCYCIWLYCVSYLQVPVLYAQSSLYVESSSSWRAFFHDSLTKGLTYLIVIYPLCNHLVPRLWNLVPYRGTSLCIVSCDRHASCAPTLCYPATFACCESVGVLACSISSHCITVFRP